MLMYTHPTFQTGISFRFFFNVSRSCGVLSPERRSILENVFCFVWIVCSYSRSSSSKDATFTMQDITGHQRLTVQLKTAFATTPTDRKPTSTISR